MYAQYKIYKFLINAKNRIASNPIAPYLTVFLHYFMFDDHGGNEIRCKNVNTLLLFHQNSKKKKISQISKLVVQRQIFLIKDVVSKWL